MKNCSECRAEFQPTNNRQIACNLCKQVRELRIKKEKRQTDPEIKKRNREAVQRYRDNNRELVRQRDRKKYWSNPKIASARVNQYNKEHKMEKAIYLRGWRFKNVQHIRAWARNRYHNNPVINQKLKYRARQKRFGNVNIREIFERDGHVCFYCGTTDAQFHIDHKTPLSRGGQNTKENLVVACRNCNLRKHTLTAEEFCHARA